MSETTAGGFYYNAQGFAVNAEGQRIEGAPEKTPDTPQSMQPGQSGAVSSEEKVAASVGAAVAKAMIDAQNTNGARIAELSSTEPSKDDPKTNDKAPKDGK